MATESVVHLDIVGLRRKKEARITGTIHTPFAIQIITSLILQGHIDHDYKI